VTERKPDGMSVETWVEHQIRTAAERGAFADLPGSGKPLPKRDGPEDAYAWALAWARRQVPDASFLPPSLALGRERDDLPGRLAALTSEERVRAAVREFNDRVAAAWRTPLDGPPLVVRMHDEEERVAEWWASRPPAPDPEPAPEPEPPAARRWWRRRR
ncbi:DnaJ homologue, subfamily C, member 28, partial [Klenkia terrae]